MQQEVIILIYTEDHEKTDRKKLEQYYEDLKEDTCEKVYSMEKGFNIVSHNICLVGSVKGPLIGCESRIK